MFRFADPFYLLLLLILPALAWLYLRRERRAARGSLRFSDLGLMADLPRSARVPARHLLAALRLLSVAFLIFTLARPQTGQARETVKGQGIDIVLVLDISGSMSAEDFQPHNRLEVAKQVAQEFVRGRRHDRIGLVVFARQSFIQCPPTLDYDLLTHFIGQVQLAPDLGLDDGTAIGVALANGINRLRDSTAKSKVIILLTDGNNNAGPIDPPTAAQMAKALGIKIYAIGAGRTGGAPYLMDDPVFGKRWVEPAPLDDEALRRIADPTGGLYFHAEDAQALRAIYDRISRMEKSEVEVRRYVRYRELAWLFGVPALGLLLLELVLAHTVFRKIP